jgi:CheY-like chemotaxis protein
VVSRVGREGLAGRIVFGRRARAACEPAIYGPFWISGLPPKPIGQLAVRACFGFVFTSKIVDAVNAPLDTSEAWDFGRFPAEDEPATVLIVEDDVDVRDALADVLMDAGYRVACAGHGGEAVQYLEENRAPAAILLDLFMPIMDGWQFLERLNEDDSLPRIPVVVLTAAGGHLSCPVSPGMLLRKPVNLDRLLGIVEASVKYRAPS